jgi:hypothetical protein
MSPVAFELTTTEGGPDPNSQTLALRNCGGGILHWEIAEACPWLEAAPASGESQGEIDEVTLRVDVTGLPAGQYHGTLEIRDPQAVNDPQRVSVILHVTGTLRVPEVYDTIQAAIDAAVDGDVVLVADGTYTGSRNRDLDFRGKAITVRSEHGPEMTVIDCERQGRGFCLQSGEGPDSVVDGFTIVDGRTSGYDDGGGIYCFASSPLITNCAILNCSADEGGGIYLREAGSPTISHCVIRNNSATGQYAAGGGICCQAEAASIIDCLICENYAGQSGGGGVFVYWGLQATLLNCTIAANITVGDYASGGGIRWQAANGTITNCAIYGNFAYHAGGGILCIGPCNPSITNCTIYGNTAGRGGGISSHSYAEPIVTNCVLWADEAFLGSGPEIELSYESWWQPALTVAYSDVAGGYEAASVEPGATLIWGPGNIDSDPLFLDPDDDPSAWEENDLRLFGLSPCIDAADTTAVPLDLLDLDGDGDTSERTPLDLGGEPRFVDDLRTPNRGVADPPDYPEVVDMGAFELQFCFADLDGDRRVGLSDLATLLARDCGNILPCDYEDGDLDGDGDVDLADLAALLAVYGTACD